MKTKVCSKCGDEKTKDKFYKSKIFKDGLSFYCKKCKKENDHKHYLENKEKYKKSNREYREKKGMESILNSKICIICNKEYLPKAINQKCCSKECTKEKNRQYKKEQYWKTIDNEKRIAINANARKRYRKNLEENRKKSREYSREYARDKFGCIPFENYKCDYCGKIFDRKSGMQKYCSDKCSNIVKNKQNTERRKQYNIECWEKEPFVICNNCGKKFKRKYARKKGDFCSDKCRADNRTKKLKDNYVASLICKNSTLSTKEIPQELIEAKRLHITIKRKLKEN